MKTTAKIDTEHVWSVPVAMHDIPEDGRHFDLLCSADTRAELARNIGLEDLPRLEAKFDVTRHGADSLRVVGTVSATVGQLCVVTLEPVENEVNEAVDLIFSPAAAEASGAEQLSEPAADTFLDEGPEPLVNGIVDLGRVATEFLILGIDPYPRKPGAAFEPTVTGEVASPLAALAALQKKSGSDSSEP